MRIGAGITVAAGRTRVGNWPAPGKPGMIKAPAVRRIRSNSRVLFYRQATQTST